MQKTDLALLALILTTAIIPRFYRLDRPLADWHSWRQADTAAVTRRYLKEGIDLLHPKYDDLSNIPSGLENPQGYRMVEFPFINAFIAYTYQLSQSLHTFPIHVFSRLVNIGFYLGSSIFLFLIVLQLIDRRSAFLSLLIYLFLPFGIFYSTTVLPEIPLLFFSLGSIYFWIESTHKQDFATLAMFTIFTALALLLKPIFVFIFPALLYYLVVNRGFKSFRRLLLYLSALAILAPFLVWRHWITQFPAGIPDFNWLFNGSHIRFRPAFFRWLFADRLGRLILGYWGLIPLSIGIILKPSSKSRWFLHAWLLGLLAYLVVFATGNVTHDYYQIFTLPIIAIFTGMGLSSLTCLPRKIFSRFSCYLLLVSCSLFSLAFSWFHIRDYFNINNPAMVAAGIAVDRLTPPDSKVIAPYMGDTAFLYQTNRTGWPIGGLINQRLNQGATHYVSTNYDQETRDLESACELLSRTEEYILIDLQNCNFD